MELFSVKAVWSLADSAGFDDGGSMTWAFPLALVNREQASSSQGALYHWNRARGQNARPTADDNYVRPRTCYYHPKLVDPSTDRNKYVEVLIVLNWARMVLALWYWGRARRPHRWR